MRIRKPTPTEFANAFMWLTALAATVVLLWDSDRLWMMVVAILACGFTSIGIVASSCRPSD
jgi:hypothetical protein